MTPPPNAAIADPIWWAAKTQPKTTGARAPVVFGWVFASHQLGSAVAAFGGGVIRDVTGSYDLAWFLAGGLCLAAAAMSLSIRRRPVPPAVPPAVPTEPTTASAATTHG